jgi:hypothetical protein
MENVGVPILRKFVYFVGFWYMLRLFGTFFPFRYVVPIKSGNLGREIESRQGIG